MKASSCDGVHWVTWLLLHVNRSPELWIWGYIELTLDRIITRSISLCIFLVFILVLGIKPRALHMLSK
jgi:hypothetical protein